MSSFDRRTLLLSLTALAGCGFTPALAPGGSAAGLRGSIVVDAPADRQTFVMVQHLEQRLGKPNGASYRLAADLSVSERNIGHDPDYSTTRRQLTGTLNYRLYPLGSETVVASGKVSNFVGYGSTGNTVVTRSAEADARDRLMVILADQLVTRLIATAPDWRA
ncbi:MAG: hypothetical protein GKR99_01635 [Rhodobacteraceae bacterium]|nr:hypothetical protein [Paracoccaceae bacterium]